MRIEQLHIQNFKCFEDRTFDLDPRFTLLVGDNGAGKTTVLDALAVAAGVWLVNPPDSTLVNSGRNILSKEIRLVSKQQGDRTQFVECKPVSITATGEIANRGVQWCRQIRRDGTRTTNVDAKAALEIIENHFSRNQNGEDVLSPVIAYYGAGRTWLPARGRRLRGQRGNGPARRWEAFYNCFDERVGMNDLQLWFQREIIAAYQSGKLRPGYEAVKRAILRCVPDADDIWYDGDRAEIALSISGQAQPFTNLSAGQQTMVALSAEIAIKAVTQNAYLVSEDRLTSNDDFLPEVLQQTPGLVLIDEIDVHLHPKWQRRVVVDLKETFPQIQFVCTSHSPFIIQSLEAGELRTLDQSGPLLVEYANRSIEDIAEEIQQVDIPQQSLRAYELTQATERYFALLENEGDEEASEELKEAEVAYRMAAERYSSNPGLNAILKLEALAKQKGK